MCSTPAGCRRTTGRTPHTARRTLLSPCARPCTCPAPAARPRRAPQRPPAAARRDPPLPPKCRSRHRERPRWVPAAVRAMLLGSGVTWTERWRLKVPHAAARELNAADPARRVRLAWRARTLSHGQPRCCARQLDRMPRRSARLRHAAEAPAALQRTAQAASASHPTAASEARPGRGCRPNHSFNVPAGCACRPMTGRRCGSWRRS